MSSQLSDVQSQSNMRQASSAESQIKPSRKSEKLTSADLERDVEIILEETDTITTFRLFAQAVQEGKLVGVKIFTTFIHINNDFNLETENIEMIREENDKYRELCAVREGNDKYVGRAMQTFNNKLKDKQTSTVPVHRNHVGSQASTSIIWDVYVRTLMYNHHHPIIRFV